MREQRPSNLAFHARAGVLDRFFQHHSGGEALREKIELAIDWGGAPEMDGPSEICILDSFFSDTVSDELIRAIIRRAFNGTVVKFLLANPFGSFGSSRASSIGQDAEYESLSGLRQIARACRFVKRQNGGDVPDEKYITEMASVDQLRGMISELCEDASIQLRFFDVGPSGPLYFFGDVLVAGRFSAGVSAAELPWEMIVWSPNVEDDLFRLLKNEFEYVWNSAISRPTDLEEHSDKTPLVFISYVSKDSGVASELNDALVARGAQTYMFERELEAGSIWSDSLRETLKAADELVVIISETSKRESDWIRAEAGAAWVIGANITPATLSCSCDILPGILDQRQQIDISTDQNKKELVNTIARRWELEAADE